MCVVRWHLVLWLVHVLLTRRLALLATSRAADRHSLMKSADDNSTLRICDFGLSRRLKRTSPSNSKRRARAVTKTLCGTAEWMAPEASAEDCLEAAPRMEYCRLKSLPLTTVGTLWAMLARLTTLPQPTLPPTLSALALLPSLSLCLQVLVCAIESAGGYSFSADVWAAGCIIYSILSGRFNEHVGPFSPHEEDEADPDVPLESVFQAILEKQLTYEHVKSEEASEERIYLSPAAARNATLMP